jgi:hypothetical protein
MHHIIANTDRDSRCSLSSADVMQLTGATNAFRLHAVNKPRTRTNFQEITLPISALPVQETGLWMASAGFIERGNAHGEKTHEHN